MKKLLSFMSLTSPLIFLFSYLFIWSKNISLFRFEHYTISFVFVFFISCCLFFVGRFLENIFCKSFVEKEKLGYLLSSLFFSFVISCVFKCFFLDVVFKDGPLLYPYFAFACFFVFFYLKKVKIINLFFAVLVLLSFFNFLFNFINIYFDVKNLKKEIAEEAINADVVFDKKPNVYLIWLESYQDFKTQENVYNIDTANLKSFLNKNSFVVKDNVYSSFSSTIKSLSDAYTLGLTSSLDDIKVKGSEIAYKDIISGAKENFVFKTFKNNGYSISQMLKDAPSHPVSFYFNKDTYIDRTDYLLGYRLKKILFPCYYFFGAYRRYKISFYLAKEFFFLKKVFNEIDLILASEKPAFFAMKAGAGHFYAVPFSKSKSEDWVAGGVYKRLVEAANSELEYIINKILAKDKDSIIVLIGDHGSLRYGQIAVDVFNDEKKLKERLLSHQVNNQEFADDLFKVFFAIRMPNGEKVDITNGDYINNASLFRCIFSYLSDDKLLLKTKSPQESFYQGVSVIKDNKLLF